jgi:hypothetical protein
MSTLDFEMSARGSVPALKARGIEINKKGNAGGPPTAGKLYVEVS